MCQGLALPPAETASGAVTGRRPLERGKVAGECLDADEQGRQELVSQSLELGLYPFIAGDLMKVFIAATILPGAWVIVGKKLESRSDQNT